MTMCELSVDDVRLYEKLQLVPQVTFGARVKRRRVKHRPALADTNAVYEIGDRFIALLAPHAFPDTAAAEASAIRKVKGILSDVASEFVIDIVSEGRLEDGRSFVVLPRGQTISRNRLRRVWQRRSIVPSILDWLRRFASIEPRSEESPQDQFAKSLSALMLCEGLPGDVRASAERGFRLIDCEELIPRFCPMHGDLWGGNTIIVPGGAIKVIDWRGFCINGYGLFDLVKFCESMRVGKSIFREELAVHCSIVKVDTEGALATLLAGCGHHLRNLGEFPVSDFIQMTTCLYNYFTSLTC